MDDQMLRVIGEFVVLGDSGVVASRIREIKELQKPQEFVHDFGCTPVISARSVSIIAPWSQPEA
jgi:hypothetical protein